MSAPPPRGYRPLTRTLLVAYAGCLLMVVLRWLLTGGLQFAFLLWNLFLAWIPYFLCLLIRRVSYPTAAAARPRLAAVVLGLGWLLFYPNAPYILTDFSGVGRASFLLTLLKSSSFFKNAFPPNIGKTNPAFPRFI